MGIMETTSTDDRKNKYSVNIFWRLEKKERERIKRKEITKKLFP